MTDVFHEVDREVREDALRRTALRWAPLAGGVAAAILIGVGVMQLMAGQANTARGESAEAYGAALRHLQAQDVEAAEAALAGLAAEGAGAYAAFAQALHGAIHLDRGDRPAAQTAFETAAAAFEDRLYADLAALKAAYARFDTASRRELEFAVRPLAGEDRPYWAAARELLAAAALRDGDIRAAREGYEGLQRRLAADFTEGGALTQLSSRVEAALAVIAAREALAGLAMLDAGDDTPNAPLSSPPLEAGSSESVDSSPSADATAEETPAP